MNHPGTLSIKDFTYSLPEEKIARYPLPDRHASKLLIYHSGHIREEVYRNIADQLSQDSLLIFNDTKVVEARLFFQKITGGVIELFCLEPHERYTDITSAMQQKQSVLWKCLVGGASKWKRGQVLVKKIVYEEKEFHIMANYVEKLADSFTISFSWDLLHLSFAEILHLAGAIPLPPYIKREAEESDSIRYQTIYANKDGSVAAPTAGLHFTDHIFKALKEKNIQTDFVTLHVGAGTFKPVKSEFMESHYMHAEYFTISKNTIENLLNQNGKNIIAVGTTSLRTIESLYWLGLKLMTEEKPVIFQLSQWEVYDHRQSISVHEALSALLNWMKENSTNYISAKTQIMIAPGYKFKIANGLITNFHQPQSTLLLLVAAFIGHDWKKIYYYALENEFRFLSYGDGCLLWKNQD